MIIRSNGDDPTVPRVWLRASGGVLAIIAVFVACGDNEPPRATPESVAVASPAIFADTTGRGRAAEERDSLSGLLGRIHAGIDRGLATMIRLQPSEFTDAPDAVRSELVRRGCTIPQVTRQLADSVRHNVVSGEFTRSGQTDWAAVCSIRDTSTLLVFRAGSASSIVELNRFADRDMFQGVGDDTFGYSAMIGAARPAQIRSYAAAYNGDTLPVLDHDGVEVYYVGKASSIRYWFRGVWHTLQGAD